MISKLTGAQIRTLLALAALATGLSTGKAASAQLRLPGFEPPKQVAEAPSQPEEPDAPASTSAIPALAIPERAREVQTNLRNVQRAQDAPELDRIAAGQPHFLKEISELSSASEMTLVGSRSRELYDLLARWESLRIHLNAWQTQLKHRADTVQSLKRATEALRLTWQATHVALADESDVPPRALAKSEQMLREIAQAHDLLAASAKRLFELGDGLADAEDRLEFNLDQVRSALLRHDKRMTRTGIALWPRPAAAEADLLPPLRAHTEHLAAAFRAFMNEYGARLPFDLALLAAFLLAAFLLAQRAQKRAAASGREVQEALRSPIAAAFLVAFVAGCLIYFRAMFAVFDLLSLGSLACLFRLAPRLARYNEMTNPVRVLVSVLALHRVLLLLSLDRPWHELAMLLVGALLLAAVFWTRRTRPSLSGRPGSTLLEHGLALCLHSMMLGMGVALTAGLFGYDALLTFLIEGVMGSAYWLLLSIAITRALHAFIIALLESDRLKGLTSMQQHGDLIQRRALNSASLFGVFLWFGVSLSAFGLMAPLVKVAGEVLGKRAVLGTWSLSLGDLARFGVTMYAATVVARLIRFVLEHDVLTRMNLGRGVAATISRLTGYVLLFLGFVLAVGAAGVDMSRIALLASALSVGVGFGLQNLVNNFVSGLMLIFERPVRVGDVIQLGDGLTGEVRKIGIRSSTVRTYQGAEVIVPNANLISDVVINWTLSDLKRRIEIPLSVGRDSQPDEVITSVEAALADVPEIERLPAPVCILKHMGEGSLDFELRIWVRHADDWPEVRSTALCAVYKKLEGSTIELGLSIFDVNLRWAGAPAKQQAEQRATPPELPAAAPSGPLGERKEPSEKAP